MIKLANQTPGGQRAAASRQRFLAFLVVTLALSLTATLRAVDDRPGVLVIIHAQGLDEAAAAWDTYRASQGWTVHRFSTGSITKRAAAQGQVLTQDQVRETLRSVLREMHDAFRSSDLGNEQFCVLLLGDAPDWDRREVVDDRFIPTWYHEQHDRMLLGQDGLRDIATDHDYQLADNSDALPDFPLGRVPARTNDQASAVLEKIRLYESGSDVDGNWRRHIMYFASEGRFGVLDALLENLFVQMADQVVPYAFDVSMAYAKIGSPYAVAPEHFTDTVIKRINAGALMVTYLGHGQADHLDRWYIGNDSTLLMDISDVPRMVPKRGQNPIAVFIACWTGQYDRPDAQRSLAEEMLLSPGSAVAVIAGSRITHPLPSGIYHRHLTQIMLNERGTTIGAADLRAARRLAQGDDIDRQLDFMAGAVARLQSWDTSPADLRPMHMSLYNLLGDPTTRIALPRGQISNLKFEMSDHQAIVTGQVDGTFAGSVHVRLEARRTAIMPHDDEDTRPLWERMNDRVLLEESLTLTRSDDARFQVSLDAPTMRALAERFGGQLILKAVADGTDGDGTPVDAASTLQLDMKSLDVVQ